MTIEITRQDKTAIDLRREAARSLDAKATRRMLAIALVLDGTDRKTAAESCGMDRQTLRDRCPAGYAKHAREEGFTATMRKVCPAFPTVARRARPAC